ADRPAAAPARRTPLLPPLLDERDEVTPQSGLFGEAGEVEADSDDVMEMVWGASSAGDAVPIIVEGVPDVSERVVVPAPLDDEDVTVARDLDAPGAPARRAARPTTPLPRRRTSAPPDPPADELPTEDSPPAEPPRAPTPLPEPQATFRSLTTPVAGVEIAGHAIPEPVARMTTAPMRRPRRKEPTRPGEWADGSALPLRPPHERFDVAIAGDAPPIGEGIVARHQRPRTPIALMALALAGGAAFAAVMASGGGDDDDAGPPPAALRPADDAPGRAAPDAPAAAPSPAP